MRRYLAVFLAVFFCTGCDGDDIAPDGLAFVETPTVRLSDAAPLAATVAVDTTEPTRLLITVTGGAADETDVRSSALSRTHVVTVLGFAADATHSVTIAATDATGNAVTETVAVTTAPFVDGFPTLTTELSRPELMEPGVTLFNVPRLDNTTGGFIVIVNAAGEVVWYHHSTSRPTDVRRLANGNLLVVIGDRVTMVEIDMLGAVVQRWHASGLSGDAPDDSVPVATDSLHHEVLQTDAGLFLGLSSEHREVADFPTSETDPTPRPTDVIGDVVVEFDRDGAVVDEWSLFDLLDPTRIAYDSYGPFWTGIYTDADMPRDWTHGNAVVPDPRDDGVIVSARHQDAVFKFDRDGVVKWILGPPENWTAPHDALVLTGVGAEFTHSYHTHAPEITPSGTLLVFDNAVHRASPPAPKLAPTFSRAVEYAIDEVAMTATIVWQYADDHCRIVGDADMLDDTGNVLITFGALEPVEDDQPSARIVEVTHDTPAERVFSLAVDDDNPDGPARRVVYRAERLPSLYP